MHANALVSLPLVALTPSRSQMLSSVLLSACLRWRPQGRNILQGMYGNSAVESQTTLPVRPRHAVTVNVCGLNTGLFPVSPSLPLASCRRLQRCCISLTELQRRAGVTYSVETLLSEHPTPSLDPKAQNKMDLTPWEVAILIQVAGPASITREPQ